MRLEVKNWTSGSRGWNYLTWDILISTTKTLRETKISKFNVKTQSQWSDSLLKNRVYKTFNFILPEGTFSLVWKFN